MKSLNIHHLQICRRAEKSQILARVKQELEIRMALGFTTATLEDRKKMEKCLQNIEGKVNSYLCKLSTKGRGRKVFSLCQSSKIKITLSMYPFSRSYFSVRMLYQLLIIAPLATEA